VKITVTQIAAAVQECAQSGIDKALVREALGLDLSKPDSNLYRAIERLSGELSDLLERQTIGRAVVNLLIAVMLQQCTSIRLSPPQTLTTIVTDRLQARKYRAHGQVDGALQIAALYKIAKPEATSREIGAYSGVDDSLIRKWTSDGKLALATAAARVRLERDSGMPARVAATIRLWPATAIAIDTIIPEKKV
jgi:hypothetical protein